MKYLNILTACAGLAIAVPTLNPSQTEIDEANKICEARGLDLIKCEFNKFVCRTSDNVGAFQWKDCMKVVGKKCVNHVQCGPGYQCIGDEPTPPGERETCYLKYRESQAGEQESASAAKEPTQDTTTNVATPSRPCTKKPINSSEKNPVVGAKST